MAAGVVVVTHYNHSWNIDELLERLSTSCFNMMDHIDHLSRVMTHSGTPQLWTTISMIQAHFYWLNLFQFTALPRVLLSIFDLYCSSSHAYLWLIPCQELHLDGLLENPLPVALCSWTDYLQVKEDWFDSKNQGNHWIYKLYSRDGNLLSACDPDGLSVRLWTYFSGFRLFKKLTGLKWMGLDTTQSAERNKEYWWRLWLWVISVAGIAVAVLLCFCHAAIAIWPSRPTVERRARLQTMVLNILNWMNLVFWFPAGHS